MKARLHISYVYMGRYIQYKGLIIKMLHVSMAIGTFCSNSANSERKYIPIKGGVMLILIPNSMHVYTYSDHKFLFGVKLPSLHMLCRSCPRPLLL